MSGDVGNVEGVVVNGVVGNVAGVVVSVVAGGAVVGVESGTVSVVVSVAAGGTVGRPPGGSRMPPYFGQGALLTSPSEATSRIG